MDFTPGARALQRYWLAIVVIGVLGAGIAYASSFLLSPTYAATSRVLLRVRDVSYLNGDGKNLSSQGSVLDSMLSKSLTETSSGLITSYTVAEQVVDDLHLDVPKPKKTDLFSVVKRTFKDWYTIAYAYIRYGYYAEPPLRDGAIASTQSALSATTVKDSYLIDITARADDPDLAAAMANSANKAFIKESLARSQADSARYTTYLKQQVDDAQAQVTQAQDAVRQYRESNGITDISEQSRLAASTVDQARKDLDDVQAQLKAAYARQDTLQASLASLNPTDKTTTTGTIKNNTTAPQTVSSTSTIDAAPADTVIQTGRASTTTRAQGSSSTTRNDTTVSQDSRSETTQDTTSLAPNRVYQDVQSASLSLAAETKALEARQDVLQQVLAQRMDASNAIPQMDARLSNLELQLSTAKGVFVQLSNQYESAKSAAAQQTEDVSVVSAAVAPVYPEKPLRWLFALVGLVIGLILAVALAYLLDGGHGRARPVRGLRLPGLAAPIVGRAPRPSYSGAAGTLGGSVQASSIQGGTLHGKAQS